MEEYAGLPLIVKVHPRARRVLVKLVPNRGLEVVTPPGFDPARVPGVLESKRPWIERTRDRLTAEGRDLSGRPPELPETLEYRAAGRSLLLHYLDRAGPAGLMENGPRLQVAAPLAERGEVFAALRRHTAKKAREILLPRLDAMSRSTGLAYAAMRVRCQKTRWGSCSARGTISLNAKLLFLPPELVDHLLLHELCHTRHMDHSPRYWACVARYQPDYKRLEDAVRRGGGYVPAWFEWKA